MAFGDAYATPSQLEERLGVLNDGTFEELLDEASRAVERFTRRQFNRDTAEEPAATARRYRAVDPERLPVDDFHTLDDLAVAVNGTAWDIDGIDPRPPNGIVAGQTGWPYFDLMAISRSWPSNRRATVAVTAHWGWAAVPEAIRQATLDVATALHRGGGTSGAVRSESIDDYSVTYAVSSPGDDGTPDEFRRAVPYRRLRFGVA